MIIKSGRYLKIKKRITIDNVFELDDKRYKLNSNTNQFELMTTGDYIGLMDEIIVESNVPNKITSVIEQAKQLYIYGSCNHPFFTISVEKAIFAFEAALADKYHQVGGPKKIKGRNATLENIIQYLLDRGYLETRLELAFEIMRLERNSIAHTKDERAITIADMTISFEMLRFIVSTINQFYK